MGGWMDGWMDGSLNTVISRAPVELIIIWWDIKQIYFGTHK